MQLKEFDIILDIKRPIKNEYIEVVQGDYGTNVFNIQLRDGLNNYDLTNTRTEIVFAKPDGTTVIQDEDSGVEVVNATEGRMTCTLNTNTIAAVGKVVAEVRIMDLEGKSLTTARFNFFVRKPLITDDTIESTNEFPILNQLIATTEGLIRQVEQIEKQVPENVVDELNNLSALAGQLQSELSDLEADVNSHKAESVYKTDGAHGLEIEEGTFTPYLIFNDIVPTGVTYSRQIGVYRKIGKRVEFTLSIETSSFDHSFTNEAIRITGLPFSIAMNQFIAVTGYVNRFTKTGYTQIVPRIWSSGFGNRIIFQAIGHGQNFDMIKGSDLPSGTNIIIEVSGSYLTN